MEKHTPHLPFLGPPWEALLPRTGLLRISRQPHREICSRQLHLPRTRVDYCFINRAEDKAFLASDWLQLPAGHQSPNEFWVLIPGSRCWCCLAQRAPGTLLSLRLTDNGWPRLSACCIWILS